MSISFQLSQNVIRGYWCYSKYPKTSYSKVSNYMAYANSADPDQTAPGEQSDLGLLYVPF